MRRGDAETVHLGENARVAFVHLRRKPHPQVEDPRPISGVHHVGGAHGVHRRRLLSWNLPTKKKKNDVQEMSATPVYMAMEHQVPKVLADVRVADDAQ